MEFDIVSGRSAQKKEWNFNRECRRYDRDERRPGQAATWCFECAN